MPKKTHQKMSKKSSISSSSASSQGRKTGASKTTAKTGTKTSKPVSVKKMSATSSRQTPTRPDTAPHTLVEGSKAPAFDLLRDGGGRLSLRAFAGRKLVLFFYPRADTPGCTREAQDFSRLSKDFASHGIDVIGISPDTVKAQESFQNKHHLKTPLLSDDQHGMLEAYGAWGMKSMYGRSFMGVRRTTVLVDSKGKIARIWRNVKVDGHAEEVLAAAKSL